MKEDTRSKCYFMYVNMETEMPRGKRLESKVDEQTKMTVRKGSCPVNWFVVF